MPIAAEVLKKLGVYNPSKSVSCFAFEHGLLSPYFCRLLGVTTLDVVRARTFIGEAKVCCSFVENSCSLSAFLAGS